MDINLSGLNSTADLTKQLITLSTGILALSITFIKDILKNNTQVITWTLKTSWISFLCSIAFGIWTMMAITGTIFEITCDVKVQTGCNPVFLNEYTFPYGSNISVPLGLQILMFLTAIAFLIIFGVQALKEKYNSENKPPESANKT